MSSIDQFYCSNEHTKVNYRKKLTLQRDFPLFLDIFLNLHHTFDRDYCKIYVD